MLIAFAKAFSQNPYSIKPSSVWEIDKHTNVISQKDNRLNGDETYKLFIDGDTTLADKQYMKFYKTGILYLESSSVSYTHQYFGSVRQEGQKIYYIEKNKTTANLLFDFDMKAGDGVKGIIAHDHIVTSVETMPNGRKKFNLSKSMLHAMNQFIIEGIGTTGGLFNEPTVGHYAFTDSYLVCYSENNNKVYEFEDYLGCNCSEATPIDEIKIKKNLTASVFPNPGKQKFTLEINSSANESGTIEIFDVLGIKVYSSKFTKQAGIKRTTINSENYKKGCFYLKVENKNKIATTKFIVE